MKQAPTRLKLGQAEIIMINALSTGQELGISDRELAAAAMRVAVTLAEREGDPDGWLATVYRLAEKGVPL